MDNYMKMYESDDDKGSLDYIKFSKDIHSKYGSGETFDFSKYEVKTEEDLEEERIAAEKEKAKAEAAAAAAAAKKKEEDDDVDMGGGKKKK